jgi:hypothetical protein
MSLFVTPARVAPIALWRVQGLNIRIAWRSLAEMAALYTLTPVASFAVLVGLFRAGVLDGNEVLFYRGLALISVAFVATLALTILAIRTWSHGGLNVRDAVSAAVLALALNLSFLVVLPVTVDRSISVFILGEMTAHAEQTYSSDDMSRLFSRVYLGDYRQIDRRMREQLISGNVERAGRGYRISARGAHFIQLSKAVAWMFDSDTRLVSPPSGR